MVKSRAVALSADEVAQVVQNGEHDGRRDLSSLLSKSSDHAKVFFVPFYRERPIYIGATTIVGSGKAGPLGRVSRKQGVHNSKVGHQAGSTLLSKTGTAKTARGRKPTVKGPGNAGRGSAPAGHFNAGASAAGRDYVDLVGSTNRHVSSSGSLATLDN